MMPVIDEDNNFIYKEDGWDKYVDGMIINKKLKKRTNKVFKFYRVVSISFIEDVNLRFLFESDKHFYINSYTKLPVVDDSTKLCYKEDGWIQDIIWNGGRLLRNEKIEQKTNRTIFYIKVDRNFIRNEEIKSCIDDDNRLFWAHYETQLPFIEVDEDRKFVKVCYVDEWDYDSLVVCIRHKSDDEKKYLLWGYSEIYYENPYDYVDEDSNVVVNKDKKKYKSKCMKLGHHSDASEAFDEYEYDDGLERLKRIHNRRRKK